MTYHNHKPTLTLSFDELPEGKEWRIGKSYRVRLVLREVSKTGDEATFEVLDAMSLEKKQEHKKYFVTEGGVLRA